MDIDYYHLHQTIIILLQPILIGFDHGKARLDGLIGLSLININTTTILQRSLVKHTVVMIL